MTSALQLDKPQVLDGLKFEDYAAIDAEHSSTLKQILVSPLAYQYRKRTPLPDRDVLREGRALHTATLEPQLFGKLYAVWQSTDNEGNKRVRRGKEWEAFRSAHADRTILTTEQSADAWAIANAVRSHPVAGAFLEEQGRPELTIVWTEEATGLRFKIRIDLLCSALIDLKGTRQVTQATFEADCIRLGYAFQLALYERGMLAAGFEPRPVKIIAAQKEPPHDVAAFDLGPDVLDYGRRQLERAIAKLVECRKIDFWPGIAPVEQTLRLPSWAVYDEADNNMGPMPWEESDGNG